MFSWKVIEKYFLSNLLVILAKHSGSCSHTSEETLSCKRLISLFNHSVNEP